MKREPPQASLKIPADLDCQLLIGGLQALRTNGQHLVEVGPPLFNLLARVVSGISGGLDAATAHIEPIMLSALTNCEGAHATKHAANIKVCKTFHISTW